MLNTVIVIINTQHLDLRESAMVVITLFHTFHSYAWKAKYVDEANNGQWSTLLSVGNELMWCRNTRITSLQYISILTFRIEISTILLNCTRKIESKYI